MLFIYLWGQVHTDVNVFVFLSNTYMWTRTLQNAFGKKQKHFKMFNGPDAAWLGPFLERYIGFYVHKMTEFRESSFIYLF